MAYQATTYIASGLTQLNNQDYPLVDASAVYVTDSKRLPAALAEKLTSADIVKNLTTSNKAAESKTVGDAIAAISGGAADGASALANEADEFDSSKAYVTGEYVLHEGTLYRFVSDHDAGDLWNSNEVTEAQLGADMTVLRDALDSIALTEVTGWTDFEDSDYIKLNTSPTTIDNGEPVATHTSGGVRYLYVKAEEGETLEGRTFTVSTTGKDASRAWGFLKADGSRPNSYVAAANVTVKNKALTAPADAVFFVVNDTVGNGKVYEGITLDARMDALEEGLEAETEAAMQYRGVLADTNDLNNIKQIGLYRVTNTSLPSNAPIDRDSVIIVNPVLDGNGNVTMVVQYCYALTAGLDDTRAYYRFYKSPNWYPWLRIRNQNDSLMEFIKALDYQADRTDNVPNDYFDTTMDTGFYRVTSNIPPDAPEAVRGILIVYKAGTNRVQTYFTLPASGATYGNSYSRIYDNGAWKAWTRQLTPADIDTGLNTSGKAADSAATGAAIAAVAANVQAGADALANEAATFNAEVAYSEGKYVLYNNTLYRFTADHAAGAWTGEDATAVKIGEELGTMKAALDNFAAEEITGWSSYDAKKYIKLDTGTNPINMEDGEPAPTSAGSKVRYVYVTASEGDIFTVTTSGAQGSRAWGFVDENGYVKEVAGSNVTVVNKVLTAPADTAFFIVNDTTGTGKAYYGATADARLDNLEDDVADLETAIQGAVDGSLHFVRTLANYTDEEHLQEDANDVKQIGLYRVNKSSPTSYMPYNIPEKEAGVLVVYNLAGRLVQQYYTAYNTYFRFRNTGSTALTPWVRLRNSSDEVMEYIGQLSIVTEDTFAATTTTGFYRCVGTNTPLDAPERVTGLLLVYHSDASSVQVYYTVTNHVYSRIKTSGSWGPWKNADAGEITSLPVLDLTGDTTGMSKDTKVTLGYSIFGLTGELTCKWQGSSSLRYPKKNYTITFDNKFDAWNKWCSWVNAFRAANGIASRISVPNPSRWGQQKKYCMKANWIDPSMARNVVCARLWGQIVASRQTSQYVSALSQDDLRLTAPNYGAIDGFPCEIKINGMSNGLYTFNIPKDKWTFAMGSADTHYVLCGENNGNNACMWKAGMGVSDWDSVDEYDETASYSVGDYVYYDDTLWRCNTAIGNGGESWTEAHWTSYFAVEYVGDDIPYKNPLSSLDEAIQLIVSAGAGWDSDPDILAKLDVDSAFDYFIFACCLNCHDGLARNMLYGTYDGVRWFLSAYDLDTTFGSDAYSTEWFGVVNDRNQFAQAASMNRLAYLMVNHAPTKLKNRYHELRSGILSNANVWHELSNFVVDIPSRDYDVDRDRWQVMPGTATANTAQYMEYYRMHCDYLDAEIDAL